MKSDIAAVKVDMEAVKNNITVMKKEIVEGSARVTRGCLELYPYFTHRNPYPQTHGSIIAGMSKHGYTQITQRTKMDSINNRCGVVVVAPAAASSLGPHHRCTRHCGVIVAPATAASWGHRQCSGVAYSFLHPQLLSSLCPHRRCTLHCGVIVAPATAASWGHHRCTHSCGVISVAPAVAASSSLQPRNRGVIVDAPGPRRHIKTAAVAAARQDGDVVAIDGGGCPNKLERHLVNQTTFEEETTTLNTSLSPCAAFGFSARVSASLGCHFTARMASCGSPTGTTKPPSDSARTPNVQHIELLILAGAKYAGAGMGIRDALQLLQVLWMSVLVVLGLTRRRQSLVVVVQQMGVTEKEER
ncbi:hypothetical protein BDZ97DRAFT_1760088 [Flammula alnicola]|nr:hypothetical protein BDZ97DRAFT_1760088 [Flammula alnicola]